MIGRQYNDWSCKRPYCCVLVQRNPLQQQMLRYSRRQSQTFFFAIKEEDSGHFVTLTKRMFTQKIWQSFDGYFRDDDLHDALACLG